MSANELFIDNLYAKFNGIGYNTRTITFLDSPADILTTDVLILADASAGDIDILLPENMCFPHKYIFKKTDATTNSVNIIAALGQTIDGAAVYTMSTLGNSVTLAYDTPTSTWIALGGCCNILTSCGDLLTHNGTELVRLPVGTDGQVLTVDTSGSPCIKWANGGGGGGGGTTINISLLTLEAAPVSTSFEPVGYATWLLPDYGSYTSGLVMFSATISNRDLNVRLRDTTNSVTLGSATIAASGVHTFSVINPLTSAAMELQISQSAAGGIAPHIRGASIKYTATNVGLTYSLLAMEAKAIATAYVAIGYLAWYAAANTGLVSGKLIFSANISTRNMDVQLYDATNNVSLGTVTAAASGIISTTTTVPVGDALIQLRVKKSAAGGINPSIFGASLKF